MESRGQVEVGELPEWSEKKVEELDAALDAQVVQCETSEVWLWF